MNLVLRRLPLLLVIFLFSAAQQGYCQEKISIGFEIIDSSTGMLLPNVQIIPGNAGSLQSNAYGHASYQAKKDSLLTFYICKDGYRCRQLQVVPEKDTLIRINLAIYQLAEIVIYDSAYSGILGVNSHALVITTERLDKIPLLMGEKDIAKALQLLPGVQSANEASSGLYVRGGGADQNQFLLDDVPVHSINHLFGMVSAFNPAILKEATFYKGDFPARYGGKLSSVIDIRMREGNEQKFHGGFSISPVSGKLYLEGPIIKEKLSFLLSGRRSFIDYLTSTVLEEFTDYDRYSFHDINFKMKWNVSTKDRLYLSVYNGHDGFSTAGSGKNSNTDDQSELHWGNTGGSLRWNRIFSNSVFANATLVYSQYEFLSELAHYSSSVPDYIISYSSRMKEMLGKYDIVWQAGNSLTIRGGLGYSRFELSPGESFQLNDTTVSSVEYEYNPSQGYAYAEANWAFAHRWELSAGLREEVYRNDFTQSDLQPRIHLDYRPSRNSNYSIGYSRTQQNMHQLTNTAIGLPSDLWVPVLENLPGEEAHIVSAGSRHHRGKFALAMDVYYRSMRNIIDYKPGSTFLNVSQDPQKNHIPDWTQNVTQGNGTAYGYEFMLEKPSGRFTGSLAYSLSWAKRQFEEINFGQEFPAPFDRRHNVSVMLNYRLRRNALRKNAVEFSAAWIYASANPVTLPSGIIDNVEFPGLTMGSHQGGPLTTYNKYIRLNSFHRLDVAVRLTRAKDSRRIWEFGVYNAYNRANPYYYDINYSATYYSSGTIFETFLVQKSYFSILPYLSYEIKF